MLLRPNVTRPNVIRWKCTRRNVTDPANHALSLLFCSIYRCRDSPRVPIAPSWPLSPSLAYLSHFLGFGLAGSVPLGFLIWYQTGAPPLSLLLLAFPPLRPSLMRGGLLQGLFTAGCDLCPAVSLYNLLGFSLTGCIPLFSWVSFSSVQLSLLYLNFFGYQSL